MNAVSRMRLFGLAALPMAMAMAMAAGCSSTGAATTSPVVVTDAALEQMMLTPRDIQATMQSAPFKSEPVQTVMDDNRHLLKNVNCLGVWNSAESAIYGDSGAPGGWRSVRKQVFRTPGLEPWRSSVTQSIVSFETAKDAARFFSDAGDRWSQCAEHTVNITINDQRLPYWHSGELRTDANRLAIPISRSDGVEQSSCEHALSQVSNVIIEVQACLPQNTSVAGVSDLSARIARNIPTAG